MFKLLEEGFWCEEFYSENSLLLCSRHHQIEVLYLTLFCVYIYYQRRHFVFYNALGCQTHPKGCKIVKCYICYRKSIKKIKSAFPVYIK